MGDKIRFVVKLAKSRWLVVVAAIWIQCCGGATYSFSIYSQALKDAFHYNQERLDTLATFKDLGANIGVVSGLIFDWFSPQGVLAIGAVQSAFAYLMLWLSVTGRVATPELWLACLYTFLAANGQTFFNTGCVVTCVQNFPQNRGIVIGLMKGSLGLSGAIMTQLYHAIYGNEPSSYLLMVTWLPSLTTLFLMFIIRKVPVREERQESTKLYMLSTMAVSLAAFLTGVTFLETMISVNHAGYVAICVVTYGILLLPVGVVVSSELQETASNSYSSLRQPLVIHNEMDDPSAVPQSLATPISGDVEGGGLRNSQRTQSLARAEASTPNSASNQEFDTSDGGFLPEKRNIVDVHLAPKQPCRGEDHTIPDALVKADFWLLSLAMACGMGSGLTAIDNTGQIGTSLGYSSENIAAFISLFSIWNFLGRLGFGVLSEMCLHRYKIGRPVLLASSQAVMALGHLLISSAIPGSLYPGMIVIGLCYGAQWSLMPAITSELFGLHRFATLFNTISIASPLGAYFLSVQVAGRLYDAEAAKELNQPKTLLLFRWLNSEDLDCHGPHCFRLTFLVMAAASLLGCLVCVHLVHRTKSFYARMHHDLVARH